MSHPPSEFSIYMSTPQAFRKPTNIYVYLDGDGTIYPDLQLYLGLGNPIPELNYFPKWTGKQLNDHFVKVQLDIKERRTFTGETFTGPDVVNGELCLLARKGILQGLSNAVLFEAGRREITLHRGVVDFMRDARELAHRTSEGLVDVRFIINSSNLRAGLLGSELGRLLEGPDPLVTAITGQSFREDDGVIAYAQRTFSGESKADLVHEHLADGLVDPEDVIVVADGMTDRMLFRSNSQGMNVLVNDLRNPDRFLNFSNWARQQPNVRGPLPTDWRRARTSEDTFGVLYMTLMGQIRTRSAEIFERQKGIALTDSRISLGTYADRVDNDFARVLDSLPSSNANVRVLNGDQSWAQNRIAAGAARAASRFQAKVMVDPRSARAFVRSQGDTPVLQLLIPSVGSSDIEITKMMAALTGMPTRLIELPERGSKPFETKFGRLILRRVPEGRLHDFSTMSSEVKNGSHAGFQVGSYIVPFAISNDVLERSTRPVMNFHAESNGHVKGTPLLAMS